jgi:HAD superfamily hydrolase (TIGR01549 family)
MNWQAVFFDFDGVIVDSASIKTKAFAAMFRPFGDAVEKAVVAYHLEHQGISRFDKFRYFYEHILQKPLDDQKLAELGNDFSKLVLQAVINAPYMPGAMETLIELKSMNIPAYIVSGTPEEEIRYVVKKKDLTLFFLDVLGSPKKKDEIIHEILRAEDYLPSKCLFIGYALTDYSAAHKEGIEFLGIVMDGMDSPFPHGTWVSQIVTANRLKYDLKNGLLF